MFADALKLPPRSFDSAIDRHDSVLVIHHYPEQKEPPVPGQLRQHEHSDIGLFTLLRTEEMHRPGGLEVKNRAGDWVAVPPVGDSFIVNIGDTMMRWTNDRWISTMRRVANPPWELAAGNTRMSIPFFFKANYDALLECLPSCCSAEHPPRYEPVTAGRYSDEKFGKVYVGLKYDA
jgi:isopenicillin N synthase-like dioxygenase